MTAEDLLAGHPELVGRVRQLFRDGATVPEVISLIQETLSLPSGGRVAVAYCLVQAFGLSLGEAGASGAWEGFPVGTWSNSQVDSHLRPLIVARRGLWDVDSPEPND